jgi:hypothetical protein
MTAMRRAAKRRRTWAWAAVLGLAAGLLAAAVPAPAGASAPSPTYAETRVWGLNPEIAAGVGAERASSPTRTEGYAARYDELAVGYPLVPRGTGFRSFPSFKRAEGAAGEGLQWHHIVEQTPGNVSRFGPEAVHNTQNLMRLDVATHRQISAYYSRIQPFTEGQTVRQWLSTQPLSVQREFGLQVLRDFGVAP